MILIIILKIINNVLATVSAVYTCAQILVFFIDLDFHAIVLIDKIQRAYVQSCGATVISKYAAMMSWAS